MPTEVEICNYALAHLGATRITSLSDLQSNNARLCNLLYTQKRDEVLRDYPWGFAERTVTLALLSGVTPVKYEYAYSYPSDCLAARSIYNPVVGSDPIDFRVMSASDGNSKMIVTDQEDAILIYTKKITNTGMFDPSFIGALALKLASALAVPIMKSQKTALNMLQMYWSYLPEAKSADAKEQMDTTEMNNVFIEARK